MFYAASIIISAQEQEYSINGCQNDVSDYFVFLQLCRYFVGRFRRRGWILGLIVPIKQCRYPLTPIETVCIPEHVQWVLLYTDIRICMTMHKHSYKKSWFIIIWPKLDVGLCEWGTQISKMIFHCPEF